MHVCACMGVYVHACVRELARVFAYKLLESPAPGMTHPVFMSSLKLSFFFFSNSRNPTYTYGKSRARTRTPPDQIDKELGLLMSYLAVACLEYINFK